MVVVAFVVSFVVTADGLVVEVIGSVVVGVTELFLVVVATVLFLVVVRTSIEVLQCNYQLVYKCHNI